MYTVYIYDIGTVHKMYNLFIEHTINFIHTTKYTKKLYSFKIEEFVILLVYNVHCTIYHIQLIIIYNGYCILYNVQCIYIIQSKIMDITLDLSVYNAHLLNISLYH